MSASYKHIDLADAVPGMILSDDVLDVHGQVLLPRETVLTGAMLDSLPHHDIAMLAILCVPMSNEDEQAALLAREKRLRTLFRKCADDDDAGAQLRRYLTVFQLGGAP